MDIFKTYYKQIIKQDLTNKFIFKNNKKVPKIKKIILNFSCKNLSIQKFAITILALEIISFKKGTITITKKPNIILKIQKGYPAGCKVELKNHQIYLFLTKLNIKIIPRLRNFPGFKLKKQIFNFFFSNSGKRNHFKRI